MRFLVQGVDLEISETVFLSVGGGLQEVALVSDGKMKQ